MPDYSKNNRLLAKNTLFLYLRSFVVLLITLYTSRIALQALGIEDYGIYNVVGGVVAMFSMLSTTMSGASQRFITYALGQNDEVHLKKVFNTSLLIHIILGLIIVVLLEIFGLWFLYNKLNIPAERLGVAFWVFQFSVATLFVNIISLPYNATIIAHEHMVAFAYISILEASLKLGAVLLLLVILVDKLLLYAAIMFCIALLLRFIYSIYCYRRFQEARHLAFHIERDIFKEMFAFAGWDLIGNASLVLRNQGIDILLNIFFGVTVNAAKGICNQVQRAVSQFVTGFQTAVYPQITKSIAQNDFYRAHSLINNGSRFSFFLLCFFAVPIIIATPQLLSLWLVEVPKYTVIFVRWTMVYMLCDTLSRFLIHGILAYGKIRNYQLVVGSTKLLALPLAYIWLSHGGSPIVGIWVNIFLEMIAMCLLLNFNRKYNGLSWTNYLKKVVLRCWIIFATIILFVILTKTLISGNIFLLLFVGVICAVLLISFVGMSAHERTIIHEKIKTYINRKSN